jgi:hypothetical protein
MVTPGVSPQGSPTVQAGISPGGRTGVVVVGTGVVVVIDTTSEVLDSAGTVVVVSRA